MDRQAFKQRMQNLKSYRENNPGKGYWDWKVEAFADGGQTGDPEKERFYQATGRSSSGRPLEEGLKPVFSLEDAANMTPIGDAISARDTYNAVRRNDKVSPSTIKQALTDIQNKSEYDSTIKASKQFKSLRGYTKWFNTIPLLGTTALGTNAYFNDNKNE